MAELLDKTLQRGWRAAVRAPDRGALEPLSRALWAWREDSFLAHGYDDEPHADRQPILLTTSDARLNAAQALFLLHQAPAGDLEPYARCVVVFDGDDEAALTWARTLWREQAAAGHAGSYWKQENGRWRKQEPTKRSSG